jgi:hypothetical protein
VGGSAVLVLIANDLLTHARVDADLGLEVVGLRARGCVYARSRPRCTWCCTCSPQCGHAVISQSMWTFTSHASRAAPEVKSSGRRTGRRFRWRPTGRRRSGSCRRRRTARRRSARSSPGTAGRRRMPRSRWLRSRAGPQAVQSATLLEPTVVAGAAVAGCRCRACKCPPHTGQTALLVAAADPAGCAGAGVLVGASGCWRHRGRGGVGVGDVGGCSRHAIAYNNAAIRPTATLGLLAWTDRLLIRRPELEY